MRLRRRCWRAWCGRTVMRRLHFVGNSPLEALRDSVVAIRSNIRVCRTRLGSGPTACRIDRTVSVLADISQCAGIDCRGTGIHGALTTGGRPWRGRFRNRKRREPCPIEGWTPFGLLTLPSMQVQYGPPSTALFERSSTISSSC